MSSALAIQAGRSPLELAREMVMLHGWNATAYQIVNPGMSLWFSANGDAVAGYVTLGLAPLSRHSAAPESNPVWLRMVLRGVRAHGRRFYNFEGLDNFKAKFLPERWEPVYAIVNERRFSPGALYAIAAAFSDRSPISTLARALWRAARTEWRWLQGRLFHR